MEGHRISFRLARCLLKMTKIKARKTIEYRQKLEKDLVGILEGLRRDVEKNVLSVLKGKEKDFKKNFFLRKEIAHVSTILNEKKILTQIERDEK